MFKLLKLLLALIIGAAFGLAIAGGIIILLTDTTLTEFADSLASQGTTPWKPIVVGVFAIIFSYYALVVIHEAGHLATGLLTGYKFVSFRVESLTFIRVNGQLRMKKFAIAGTGGQCLLSPPDVPLDKLPFAWYNWGGILANFIAFVLVLPLMFADVHPFVKECAAIFLLFDAAVLLLNGIPMKVGGIGNDAYNALRLHKNPKAMRGMIIQLKSNAAIQNGMRPISMPDEWFETNEDTDYANPLEVAPELMLASRYLDAKDYDKAREMMEKLYEHKEALIPLYVNEIACELTYLYLVNDDIDRARELFDKKLKTYVETYQKVMSSKKRLLCAIALKMDGNREKAQAVYDELLSRQGDYLHQGEVASDLDLMQDLLKKP